MRSGGFFDYDAKRERLEEVERELEHPDVWNNPERAQALGRERSMLDKTVNGIRDLKDGLSGALELLELAEMEDDEETALAVAFGRISELQRELQDVLGQLNAKQSELDSMRAELLGAGAMRADLESKLGRAREDVAAEMATLTSTMLKMKDDALREANARIYVLTTELDAQRTASGRPQTKN